LDPLRHEKGERPLPVPQKNPKKKKGEKRKKQAAELKKPLYAPKKERSSIFGEKKETGACARENERSIN